MKGVWVVLAPDDLFWADYDWGGLGAKLEVLHCGGATRAETVRAGLYALRDRVKATDWILVHDAARPCLSAESLQRLLAALVDDPVGGLLALPVADTLKRANAAQRVICTESRENLWQAQTPQLFRYARLYEGLSRCIEATDEASAIEALGLTPQLIEGDSANLKVTYAHDLQVAEAILQMRERK